MAVWLKENNRDKSLKIILFLLSPFFSFLYALRRMNTKSSYIVFFLFAVFFGMSFTVSNVRGIDGTTDGISYRNAFESYKNVSTSQYYDGLKRFFTFDEGNKDYYYDTVAFYVSRITDNYHVMFMFFAAIFAFFQLKTFRFLTTEDNFNNSLVCVLLAFLFTYNQIFNINGMRFWTAAWIGVYSIFQIFLNDNKKYFLLALCTPFFHGSFWLYIVVMVFAYFFKKYERMWVVLFFLSFIFSSFAIELVQNMVDYLPSSLARLVDLYTSEEAILSRQAVQLEAGQTVRIFGMVAKIYINLLVCLFIKNSVYIKKHTKNLYPFLLVWMTFVNFVMLIPALGGRFILLSYPLIAYIWLANFGNIKYRYWIYVSPLALLLSLYSLLRDYMSVLEFSFYYSNPLFLFYKYILLT